MAFAFPITYLRYTNRTDNYQDEIIAGGMILTVAAASMSGNVWETAMTLLPWSIILGLVLSSLIHRVFGFGRSSGESLVEGTSELDLWLDEKGRDDASRDTA